MVARLRTFRKDDYIAARRPRWSKCRILLIMSIAYGVGVKRADLEWGKSNRRRAPERKTHKPETKQRKSQLRHEHPLARFSKQRAFEASTNGSTRTRMLGEGSVQRQSCLYRDPTPEIAGQEWGGNHLAGLVFATLRFHFTSIHPGTCSYVHMPYAILIP